MMLQRSVAAFALLSGFVLVRPAMGEAQTPVRLVVNADLGEHTISRHIYGHFGEHLGRNIYDGFWTKAGTGEWHLRYDVIEALRRIRIPNLRWPGGCFADYYHWEDGVGPREKRPTMVNTIWGGITEDNSFGTHEFLDLVRRLGADPVVVGNVGSGTVKEMADWWEYVNHPGGSSLADRRAANGHPEPFNVRYWGVGNESWGCGGSMRPEYYADQYKRFAEFLRPFGEVRPFRIATGPNVDMYEWTETVMRDAGRMIDGLDLHSYTVVGPWENKGSATEFSEREWFIAMQRAQHMDELIRRHSAIMDRYDPQKRTWLIVGEWGMWHDVEPGTNPGFLYQQNTLRDALVAGLHLNIFNSHADRVKMANIAQTVNVLQSMVLTQGEQMILTPTYHVFDFYQVHQDAKLLPISLQSDEYTFEGQSVPAVSASASRDEQGRIHITLLNLDPNRGRTIQTEIRGQSTSTVTGRVLTADAMNAHNTFERPNAVQPAEFARARRSGNMLIVELPAKSVVVLELR
jgi:alpha-N-arabinofuranosidase